MKQELIDLLKAKYKDYPVILQGALAPDAVYPDSFLTIWNTESADWSHYNNDTTGFVGYFTVAFYSVNPTLVNTILLEVRTLLRANGWIVDGIGQDVPTDEISHTGRSLDVIYIDRLVPNN